MELNEQSSAPTLALRLGGPVQVTGLAMRLARPEGAGEQLSEWLWKVAIERGAKCIPPNS